MYENSPDCSMKLVASDLDVGSTALENWVSTSNQSTHKFVEAGGMIPRPYKVS